MMKKFRKTLLGACALIVANIASPLNAAEINWADPFNLAGGGAAGSVGGPYISVSGAMNGSTLSGSGTEDGGEVLKDASLGNTF